MRSVGLFFCIVWSAAALRFGRTRVLESVQRRHGGVTVALENVRKENVALIARTAEALGLASLHVIYTENTQTRGFGALSDRLKRVTLSRISRSATDWLRVCTHDSVESFLAAAEAEGLRLVATTPPDGGRARDLYAVDDGGDDWADGRVALCFGSEGHGLSDALLDAADMRLTVPQRGLTQSLNVAACASIVLGEVLRRRAFAPLPADEAAALERASLEPPVRLHNKASLKAEARANAAAVKTARSPI